MTPAFPVRRRNLALAFHVSCVLLLLGSPLASRPLLAADEPPHERLRASGIDGALVLGGGGNLPDAVLDRFVKLAGGDKANLVILLEGGSTEKALDGWNQRKPATVVIDNLRADKGDLETLLTHLDKATGVWIGAADAVQLKKLLLHAEVEQAVRKLLKRGGVLGIDGCGCGIAGKLPLSGTADKQKPATLDLLPGTVVTPLFDKGERTEQLFAALDKNPGLVGFGIEVGTALVVHGREIQVVGDSSVTVCLAASKTRPQRTIQVNAGAIQDLTALRRAAIARAELPFPPKVAAVPNVPSGTLIIIGGGGTPPDALKKFIELAGGPDGLIVVLPQSYADPIPANAGVGMFEKAGAKNVQVLRGRELADIDDPKNLEMLKKAKGIWFEGGRHWRFVDAFEGTKALDLMRDVLKRGGVIGGSSAGASIQADYLCRGSPLGNLEIMYEGYERGFGFLPGVAVDQHFTQRKRFDDMTALVKAYPQLLGIGIDESTAILVNGSIAEVMGRGKAHFFDPKKPAEEGKPNYEALKAGERYELKERKALPAADAKPPNLP